MHAPGLRLASASHFASLVMLLCNAEVWRHCLQAVCGAVLPVLGVLAALWGDGS